MSADTKHEAVKMQQPGDIKVKIWRYMSLEKLIDFLKTDELYFARGNILIDPFEGIGTRMNALGREWLARDLTQRNKGWSIDRGQSAVRNILSVRSSMIYINCWHKNDKENMAMWKVYGETDGAVVIQSTYEKLKKQLTPDYYTKNGIKVIDPEKMTREAGGRMSFMQECYYLGEVSYIDYEDKDKVISEGDVLTPFMYKIKEYEYEKEVRALTVHMAENYQTPQGIILKDVKGIRKKVNVQDLVENIRVRTGMKKDMIENVCRKYGKKIRVESSELDRKPLL